MAIPFGILQNSAFPGTFTGVCNGQRSLLHSAEGLLTKKQISRPYSYRTLAKISCDTLSSPPQNSGPRNSIPFAIHFPQLRFLGVCHFSGSFAKRRRHLLFPRIFFIGEDLWLLQAAVVAFFCATDSSQLIFPSGQ